MRIEESNLLDHDERAHVTQHLSPSWQFGCRIHPASLKQQVQSIRSCIPIPIRHFSLHHDLQHMISITRERVWFVGWFVELCVIGELLFLISLSISLGISVSLSLGLSFVWIDVVGAGSDVWSVERTRKEDRKVNDQRVDDQGLERWVVLAASNDERTSRLELVAVQEGRPVSDIEHEVRCSQQSVEGHQHDPRPQEPLERCGGGVHVCPRGTSPLEQHH